MSYATLNSLLCGKDATGAPVIIPQYGRTLTAAFTATAAVAGVYVAIATVPGRKIRVLSCVISSDTAGTVSLRDSTPTVLRSLYVTANAVGTDMRIPQPGHDLAAGLSLQLYHSAGGIQTFTGSIDYCLE
jgi:hypothetical protein